MPIYAFGKSGEGKSEVMQKYTEKFDIGGGEGVDPLFSPDIFEIFAIVMSSTPVSNKIFSAVSKITSILFLLLACLGC